ncbi:MAG TPA: hypothetical protein VGB98_02335 [Pyrinomonadaceae bacterium]
MQVPPPRPAPFYHLLSFTLFALVSFLLLVSGISDSAVVVIVLAYGLFSLVSLLYYFSLLGPVKKREEKSYERAWAQWRALSLAVLGFGVGIAVFIYRLRIKALLGSLQWRLDTTNGAFLAGLMFLGFIMGFYVVRNWLKEEEEFVKSLTAVAGVAFLASILGLAQGGGQSDSRQPLNFMSAAFANYFLGFTFSAFVNLGVYAYLTARYSASKSSSSRALIFFLYGTDKAKKLDDYFLRNFENDKNYAKMHLVHALREFRERVLREYAAKMEGKRQRGALVQSPPAPVVSPPPAPKLLYQLISIEDDDGESPSQGDEENKLYNVRLEQFTERDPITGGMFRMGITITLPDNLEYIVAPGEYKQPFPLRRSVAGLALATRQTIVMYRDEARLFRDENEVGTTPGSREAQRGFEEANYLSYVSVPVVSRLGDREESALGIINVDTLLFVAEADQVGGDRVVEDEKTIVKTRMSPKQLREYAADLYDENDAAVRYLEDMRAIAVPLLELCMKCRQGAV